jgi:UDP-sugar pyrophosphorylase
MEATLRELGQDHLLEGLTPGQLESLLGQAAVLDQQLPGGLAAYVKSARALLEQSQKGINPLAGCVPSVPVGKKLTVDSPEFDEMEALGTAELAFTGFVLVAGGLGERLGYNGIKVALPQYIVEREMCFLELYLSHISSMQRARGQGRQLPVAIMTSDDTHALTLELLKENNNFGLPEGQITIMKQNKVPAMIDATGKFSGKNGVIDTKPHGHGDVHTLLHQHGCISAWARAGVRWVVFFQDTNGPIFRAVPAVLGVSAKLNLACNSVCVPRTPGEAVGGICRLARPDGSACTINVEYNQLDPLLRSTAEYSNGDTADASGFSPFPGNINCLVFALEPYEATLAASGGRVPEFVNPKYADSDKLKFKSPTRLECMMQDLPGTMSAEHSVGFTQLERWLCFSPVKNNLGSPCAGSCLLAHCACLAILPHTNCVILQYAGLTPIVCEC